MSNLTTNEGAVETALRELLNMYNLGGRSQQETIDRLTARIAELEKALRFQEASGSRAAIVELNTYADHTFMCAISEQGPDAECTCGYEQAERAALGAPVEPRVCRPRQPCDGLVEVAETDVHVVLQCPRCGGCVNVQKERIHPVTKGETHGAG